MRLHPGQDVGYLHDVEPTHHAVKARTAGQQSGTAHRRHLQDFTHGDTGGQVRRSLACWQVLVTGGHRIGNIAHAMTVPGVVNVRIILRGKHRRGTVGRTHAHR